MHVENAHFASALNLQHSKIKNKKLKFRHLLSFKSEKKKKPKKQNKNESKIEILN